MLIKRRQLERTVRGEVDLAFQRRKRPKVPAGGRPRTAMGVLAIDDLEQALASSVTAANARLAGFESLGNSTGRLLKRKPDQPKGLPWTTRRH